MEKRQRWEYCEVNSMGEVIYYASTGDHPRDPRRGSPQDHDQRILAAVAMLGESGWESYAMMGNPSHLGRIFLKRLME